MRNFILGVLSGLSGALLYSTAPKSALTVWALFLVSIGLMVLAVDVFFGSREENQPRAARMGLVLFGIPGTVMQTMVWILAT